MTSVNNTALSEQRHALRKRLHTHRQLIAHQLDLVAVTSSYPRSVTMRFLTRNTALSSKLFTGIATVLGVRLAKSLSESLLTSKLARHKAG